MTRKIKKTLGLACLVLCFATALSVYALADYIRIRTVDITEILPRENSFCPGDLPISTIAELGRGEIEIEVSPSNIGNMVVNGLYPEQEGNIIFSTCPGWCGGDNTCDGTVRFSRRFRDPDTGQSTSVKRAELEIHHNGYSSAEYPFLKVAAYKHWQDPTYMALDKRILGFEATATPVSFALESQEGFSEIRFSANFEHNTLEELRLCSFTTNPEIHEIKWPNPQPMFR